jgi:hypothetical protein
LVEISAVPPYKISYCPVKPRYAAKKLNPTKYHVFSKEVVLHFPDKVLTNDIGAYIEVMEEYSMETNAMLMIIGYCVNYKGKDVSLPYILAVANAWAQEGLTTEAKVNERIEELEANSLRMREIFKTLGLKSAPDINDRQFLHKWENEYGFNTDAVLTAARSLKRKGGIERLDKLLTELYEANSVSAFAINGYLKGKEARFELAASVVKSLGGYYANLDPVITTYINDWLQKGFDPDALQTLANYCFIRNIRTLDAMGQMVDKFYKLGLMTEARISQYVAKQTETDNRIKNILELASAHMVVSARDREYYRTWIEEWGFDDAAIEVAAVYAKSHPFPMTGLNKLLAELKEAGIYGADTAAAYLKSAKTSSYPAQVVVTKIKDEPLDVIKSRRASAEEKCVELKNSILNDPFQGPKLRQAQQLLFEKAKLKALGQDYADIDKKLSELDVPTDFKPDYTCKKCSDTGHIKGNECECLKALRAAF